MRKAILSGLVVLLLILQYACKSEKRIGEMRYFPQFHFSTSSGWTGEPSGLVYDDEEYHLFYQYNPSEAMYGNIHWAHAVSRDLIEWEVLPIALAPDSLGFLDSGSVIVDQKNTSGLGTGENKPFIAYYAYHGSDSGTCLAMAYSLDKGRSWIRWNTLDLPGKNGSPLRYPHVSWHEGLNKWVMTGSTGSSVLFYTSVDCKHWEYESEFQYAEKTGNVWEGSNLFPLLVEGTDQKKWVLSVNMRNGLTEGVPATRYFIGDFDGTSFHPTQAKELWLDYGKDNYGGSAFHHLPTGNYIWIGWMNCWEYANLLPTTEWRGSMTFPRCLSLIKEGKHYVLSSAPVSSLDAYAKKGKSIISGLIKLSDEKKISYDLPDPAKPFALFLKFNNTDNMAIWRSNDYGVCLRTKSGKKLLIGYQNELSYYYINRSGLEKELFSDTFGQLIGASYRPEASISDWTILVDKSSVELFADKGRIAMTALCYPDDEFSSFEIYSESGMITLIDVFMSSLDK